MCQISSYLWEGIENALSNFIYIMLLAADKQKHGSDFSSGCYRNIDLSVNAFFIVTFLAISKYFTLYCIDF